MARIVQEGRKKKIVTAYPLEMLTGEYEVKGDDE